MESDIFRYELEVAESEIDEMNHVNNLQYLRWCLKAAVSHSADVGWTSQRYRELGFGFIVREHQIKYRVPAVLGDQIEIRTWIDSLERVSSVRKYRVLRKSDGKRLAEGQTNWVFVDLNSLALTRIPDEIKAAFQSRATESSGENHVSDD